MALKIHHLRPTPGTNTVKTRVGRGKASKSKTASRGMKGMGVHKNVPASFEGGQMSIHMQVLKLKGFENPFHVKHQAVNVDRPAESFPRRGAVMVGDLVEAGAVYGGTLAKVLGDDDISIALSVTADTFPNPAKEKLTATDGSAVKA